MQNQHSRTAVILGDEALAGLRRCRVAVFGIGGVGGYAAEALARCGVGRLDLIDSDTVALTNLNRQIIALHSTLGQDKTEVFRKRIQDIDPEIQVQAFQEFYLPENAHLFPLREYDFVVDAIDTVTAKIDLICRCTEAGIPIISAMGCGNRFDPSKLRLTDISKTHTDPLAKVMRTELRKRGIQHLPVVFSEEPPILAAEESAAFLESERAQSGRRSVPGSIIFVPAAAGLLIASEVIRTLTDFDPDRDKRRKGQR